MKERDLDIVETELNVELPQDYRDLMLRYRVPAFNPKKEFESLLKNWLIVGARNLIRANEEVMDCPGVAGLRRWPLRLFVFADDGGGNLFAFFCGKGPHRNAVVFFDHDRDEIEKRADSFGELIDGILNPKKVAGKRVILYSGREKRRQQAKKRKWSPTEVKFGPKAAQWQTDWPSFLYCLRDIILSFPNRSQRIAKINSVFGQKPVRWIGEVDELHFSDNFSFVGLSLSPSTLSIGADVYTVGRLSFSPRTGGAVALQTTSKQILTSKSVWEKVQVGATIQFTMMISPGIKDELGCIDIGSIESMPFDVVVHDCGGHLVKIISGPPPANKRNWRAIEKVRIAASGDRIVEKRKGSKLKRS